ncbi:hypothetical protein Taro_055536, partial [Colocasia esculenta]|nr:hypothetical protein [Colocasia esculenta]
YSVKILRRGTSKVPGRRKANPKSLEMAVTYGPLVVNNHTREKGKSWTAPVIATARYAAITGVSRSAFRPRHERDGHRRRVPKPEPGQAGRFACRAKPHHRDLNRDRILQSLLEQSLLEGTYTYEYKASKCPYP